MTTRSDGVQATSIRFPAEEYEALRTYAHITNTSVNEAVVRAVREFLADPGRREQFDTLLDAARNRYRVALDKLADL